MSRRGYCIVLVAVAAVCGAAAQGLCGWTTYTTADGLAGNSVNSILEDRSGSLWFGTSNGIGRYDGAAWATFTTSNGLPGNYVYSAFEDRAGNLWVGTDHGASRYDGTAWTVFPTPADQLPYNRVYFVFEDDNGDLWFGTDGGVSRYDGAGWRTFTTADGLGDNGAAGILEDRSGNLWLQTGFGVSRYDGTTWRTFTTADGLAGNYVFSMTEDGSGQLLFGTGGTVSRFDGTAWSTFPVMPAPTDGAIYAMREDRTGALWVAAYPGLRRYDGSKWRSFATGDGLAHDRVTSVLQDRSGNLWFGTSSGVSRFDESTWEAFTTMDGLPSNSVRSTLQDRSGNLWFGTETSGLARFDGSTWRTFTTGDGLASNSMTSAAIEDREGRLWFGTLNGVARYDGVAWIKYTTADGLPHPAVYSILEDRSGSVWFGTGYGVGRFNGSTWSTLLPGNVVESIIEDRSGNVWCSKVLVGFESETPQGVGRFDGTNWTNFTTADGLPDNTVHSILEDRRGNLWFGTRNGASRFDGTAWQTFTIADGIADNDVQCVREDRSGNLWFGTAAGGVSRYDGLSWRTFTTADGLADNRVTSLVQDRSGSFWFALGGVRGMSRYEPDRIPPQTLLVATPPRATAERNHAISFAAFGEIDRIDFSFRIDSGEWSAWSRASSAYLTALGDGPHLLEARSRDYLSNTDSTPATTAFEVDAAPPAPLITAPAFGEPVRARVEVRGVAADPRFASYHLEARPEGASSWDSPDATLLAASNVPVSNGPLASWDTSALPDGLYQLRLSVLDSLRLTGVAQTVAIVDNHAPFADVTTPARITAATGGDVFTTNSELRLYFPPRAFGADVVVNVTPAADGAMPDTLPSGAVLESRGFEITWAPESLRKPARLEMSRAGASGYSTVGTAPAVPSGTAVSALWHSRNGSVWERVGGTVSQDFIEAAITEPGRYALYSEANVPFGEDTLSPLSFTPRVFSPTGTFADREVGIGFRLGRPAKTTVRVYARSGRLVREVLAGVPLGAGSNLIRWDGKDRGGNYVTDGLYLVTVEALGRTEKKPIAVVK